MPSVKRSRGVSRSIARPSKIKLPPKYLLTPYTALSSVDLPAPLGPMMVVMLPAGIEAVKSRTMGSSP